MESSSTQIAAEGANITHMDAKFYNAAAHGHINILEQMSEDDIRFQLTPKENTILHIAARADHFGMVNALVCSAKALNEEMESGVDADKTMLRMMNLEKETAFHQATPLYMAVERGFGDLVDMIISSCTSAAHTGILGRTVLNVNGQGMNVMMFSGVMKW
ncbi:hypothetical protein AAG906_016192 [Vitis piasezkii]